MQELLHQIDKKLAVLEAMSEQHSEITSKEFSSIHKELEKMQNELSKLKVRVATISGGISLAVAVLAKMWS